MFHSVFTPSRMSLEELTQTLVQRERLVERVVNVLRGSKVGSSTHNMLFIGPRGIGKTHLVSLIYKRLQADDEFKRNNSVAYLKEDEWGVSSYVDLLTRIAGSLLTELGRENLLDKLGQTGIPTEESVVKVILDCMSDKNTLLIIENLDHIFGALQREGQQKLRGLLQNYPRFNILATTPSLFSGIAQQSSPFYGFFQLTHLKPLSVENAVTLMGKLSAVNADESMLKFINTPVGRARIRAVQHLAGGNHRIFVLFYDFLRQSGAETVIGPLLRTIDALTPYYQSQMAKLSPQQQKIVAFLCQQRTPVNVKHIAESCFMSQQTAASQLKQILEHRYVRAAKVGRESYYELAEPLLRICVEVKTHREGPLKVLVEFLRFWFSREELEEHLSDMTETCLERTYFNAALREYDSSEGHEHLSPEIAELCISLDSNGRNLAQRESDALELAELSKRAEDWTHYVRGMNKLSRAPEAAEYLLQKMQNVPLSHGFLDALGTALQYSGKYEEALPYFQKASEISPDVGFTYLDIADCLLNLARFEEAAKAANIASNKDKRLKLRAGIFRGRVLLEKGSPGEALKLFRQLEREYPANDELLNWYAAALSANGKHEEAKSVLRKAETDDLASVYIKLNLTRELLLSKEFDAALAKLDEVDLITGNSDKRTVQLRCETYFLSKRFVEAERLASREVLSHRIFHELLDIYNSELTLDELKMRLGSLASAVKTPLWQASFIGALVEFLKHAKKWGTEADTLPLNRWMEASHALFDNQEAYSIFLRMFDVFMAMKRHDYKALLTLTLEERRLLVTESEEQLLLSSKSEVQTVS